MRWSWQKILFVTFLVIVVIIVLLSVFGSVSEAKAASLTPAAVCKKYPKQPACSSGTQVASVDMSQTVVLSRVGRLHCKTVSNYKKWRNVLHATLFWVRLNQYVCFKGKSVAVALPPQFTHDVTSVGALLQWHDRDKESFSAGVIPWEGYPRGAYNSWASDKFEQTACVPVLGCLTLHTNVAQLWVTAAFDGDSKG
jgi:hypothetical protein